MFMTIGLFVTLGLAVYIAVKNRETIKKFYVDSDNDTRAFMLLVCTIGFGIAWVLWPVTLVGVVGYVIIKGV